MVDNSSMVGEWIGENRFSPAALSGHVGDLVRTLFCTHVEPELFSDAIQSPYSNAYGCVHNDRHDGNTKHWRGRDGAVDCQAEKPSRFSVALYSWFTNRRFPFAFINVFDQFDWSRVGPIERETFLFCLPVSCCDLSGATR